MNYQPVSERIVKYFIAINVVVFLFQLTNYQSWILQYLALSSFGWEDGRYYQIFTYMWLHGSFTHLFLNMIGLWCFGMEIARFIGRIHFMTLYLLSGLAGGALWIAFNQNSIYPMVGASAAVLGLVTSFATLFPRAKLLIFPLPMPVQARWLALGYAILTLFFVFKGTFSQVAHLAHLGGIIVGFVYSKIFLRKKVLSYFVW